MVRSWSGICVNFGSVDGVWELETLRSSVMQHLESEARERKGFLVDVKAGSRISGCNGLKR